MTVHSLRAPQLADSADGAGSDDPARRRSGRWKMLLVLLMCAAPVIASYFTYFVIRPEGRTNYGTLVLPTRSMPALTLTTLDGAPVAAASLRGQWLLVVVGPSACATACKQRLYMQRQLREMLGRESARLDKVWFITDEAPLSSALQEVIGGKAPLTALRVPRDAVARWLVPAEGRALEDHLYLVDPMGEWMMRMPPGPDPGRVKRDLDRVLRASASWDLPRR